MQIISSKDNEIVKSIKKLKEKRYRDLNNKFIIEGIKIVEEAIEENAKIDKIVVCEECISDGTISKELLYKIAKFDCIYVKEKVFDVLTDVKTPQGILAVIEKRGFKEEVDYSDDIIIALDGIQDPGNLGTILRTVDSSALKQIIVSKDTVDAYSPKVVRSTMGATFRVNVVEAENLLETLKQAQKNGFEVIVTALDTENDIYDINYIKKVIVIGNEANGVSKEVQELADKKVKIPMLGKTESLNAAVATSIMVYEYVRKKLGK